MRRALSIDEGSYGAEHPVVARDLNYLAGLLQDTNRLGEAQPLMRRCLEILLAFAQMTGHEHLNCKRRSGIMQAYWSRRAGANSK